MIIVDTHTHAGTNWFEPVEMLIHQMNLNNVEKCILVQHGRPQFELVLENQTDEARKVARFFAKVGLPVHFGQLSLYPRNKTQMVEVMEAAVAAPIMANEPMAVTTDALVEVASQVHDLGIEITKSEGDAPFSALHSP